jgi:hypothetical protein
MVGSPEVQSARTEEGLIRRIDHANAAVCAAQLEFLRLVAQVDSLELWRGDGCADMAQWLLVPYGVSDWKARRWIAAAHAIDRLPRVSAAMSRGDLGIDKVVELTRFATPETERDLVEWARDVSAGRIRHRGDLARREADHEVRDGDEARSLAWWWYDEGRRFGLQADLPAAQGAVVSRAIERLADSLPAMPGEEHTFFADRRRADALVALASTRLADDPAADRATIVVHARVDADGRPTDGFEVEAGPAVPEQTAPLRCPRPGRRRERRRRRDRAGPDDAGTLRVDDAPTAPPGPGMHLSGLRRDSMDAGPSHPVVVPRRNHRSRQPGPHVPVPPQARPRVRLDDLPGASWRCDLAPAGRDAVPRRASASSTGRMTRHHSGRIEPGQLEPRCRFSASRRSSHSAPTDAIHETVSRMGDGVRWYRTSRPSRAEATRPASASAARCFETACRETGSRAASSVAVTDPVRESCDTTSRRVGSASAWSTAPTRSSRDPA